MSLWIFFAISTIILVFHNIVLASLALRVFFSNTRIQDISLKEVNAFDNDKLPVITILLPLYKEKLTVIHLLKSIYASRYPKEKLDVRLLIERDDLSTIDAIFSIVKSTNGRIERNEHDLLKAITIWNNFKIDIDFVFEGIRTKPNALNVGLRNARGHIVTIYDAEDKPDRFQLRKVAVFMQTHPEIACVQGVLAYYNANQSLLTKLFSIEYVQHFSLYLPIYSSLKNVLPLGGTSNFFRVEVLRDLGGWDPKNVTEDADLGIRLGRAGYTVVPLQVPTLEEAPPKVYPWIKQRIRWNKGYLYTLIIHFKNPLKLWKDIGIKSTIFIFDILFFPISNALSLIGWILFGVYWADWSGIPLSPVSDWIAETFKSSPQLFYTSLFSLLFGVFYVIIMAVESLFRQGDEYALRVVKYSFLMPMYHMLQGIASILSIIELAVRPQHWHKTKHGFSIQQQDI
jgi:cellulose synthase/poly-beta-1,6-N-acetylglucosamine synthase-like glycosyltransferase